MRGLARWCMAHRRRVVVTWVAVAIVATVLAHVVGPNYVTVYSLPGTHRSGRTTCSRRSSQAQSGDADTIVFHVSKGTIGLAGGARRDRRRCWHA